MLYEYWCKGCQKKYVREEKMSEHGGAVICGECGELLESIITGGSGFQLSGVSWAKDGYCNHGHACDKSDGSGPRGNGIISKD